MTENILLFPIAKEDLLSSFREIIKNELQEINKSKEIPKEWLSCKEVEEYLGISNATRYNWTKKGILKCHVIGTRKRFHRDDVLSALKRLESRRG